jgi:hypothetical protein
MRILLIAALVSSVAVAGCRGGEKNTSTAANNSASANGSGSASGGAGAGAGAGGGAASGTAGTFLQMARIQCEQAIRNNPGAPKGFDAAGTCNCAIDSALGKQADPVSFARSPEGQQALMKAMVSCGEQRMGGAGGAAGGNSAGAATEEEGEEK